MIRRRRTKVVIKTLGMKGFDSIKTLNAVSSLCFAIQFPCHVGISRLDTCSWLP